VSDGASAAPGAREELVQRAQRIDGGQDSSELSGEMTCGSGVIASPTATRSRPTVFGIGVMKARTVSLST